MTNREKVIKGLEHCDFGGSGVCYEKECPYYQSRDCTDELKNDIFVILEEQEDLGTELTNAVELIHKKNERIKKLLEEQNNCENCAIAIEDRQSVVRCKDCKHAEHCEIYAGWDGQHLDWFCADGERRDNDA